MKKFFEVKNKDKVVATVTTDAATRLRMFIDFLIGTQIIRSYAEFARQMGYSAGGTIAHMMNGATPVTDRLLSKIPRYYPNTNVNWIRTGEGHIFEEVNAAGVPEFHFRGKDGLEAVYTLTQPDMITFGYDATKLRGKKNPVSTETSRAEQEEMLKNLSKKVDEINNKVIQLFSLLTSLTKK